MRTRILIIGAFGPGDLAASYARGFEQLGLDVFRFDSDRAYFEAGLVAGNRWLRRAFRSWLWHTVNRSTVAVARAVRPQIVLAIKGTYLAPDTIALIKRELGAPFVNYYPDNPYCGVPLNPRKTSAQRRDLLTVLQQYSRVWTWESALTGRLQADGVQAAYLPFGFDPPPLDPPAAPIAGSCGECPGDHRVVFVGQHSDKREAHLSAIHRHAVALWGARWPRAGRRFDGRHAIHRTTVVAGATAQVYATADVALNVVDDLNMPGHNMRTFEIPGSGGVMLATHTAEQAAIFPDGEAALYYRTAADIDGLIDRVRAEPDLADRLRRNGQAIAREHSYHRRAGAMLAELGMR
jgi:spore maturation protein CgeB